MNISWFHINATGITIYVIYIITSLYILFAKEKKLMSIIFPLFALIEGLFIDWRWNRFDEFSGITEIIYGGLPSFLIAIGFPFIGFYLHHLIPISVRIFFSQSDLFPFSKVSITNEALNKYYKRGFIYAFSTLMLHEISQVLNISTRNTFDFWDLFFILIGSIISFILYRFIVLKTAIKY